MRRWIIVLGIFLVATTACSHTIRNAPMLPDQAKLIRSNWESLKIGMSPEQVKVLLGPATVDRIKPCYCNECTASAPLHQNFEQHWYVYDPTQNPNIFKKREDDNYFYVYLEFRHGKLIRGSAETDLGTALLK